MLRYMTLLLAASTFGNGATVDDFNDYVDRAIGSSLPPLIRNAHSIYPEARIPFHTFELSRLSSLVVTTCGGATHTHTGAVLYQVSEEFVWQNDIEVRLTEGAVKGLDVVTERRGSCSNPSQVMGATISTCTLDLSGLEATYTLRTDRGEHIFAKRKTFPVDVKVTSATASIVLASNGSQKAKLVSFYLNPTIGGQISYDQDFDLDSLRQTKFGGEISDYTSSELAKIIRGSYFTALSQAFANTCFACR